MIKKLQEELKTAKEENEKLKNQNKLLKGTIKKFNLDWYGEELDTLTQQNKQMREALEKIKKDACCSNGDCEHCEYDEDCFGYDAQQALNQANTKEKLKQLTELSQEYGLYDDVKGVE